MKETPGSAPDEALRRGAAHIQRGDEQAEGFARPVPRQWLAEHDRLPEARRLERLLADADLVQALQWENFSGPKWLAVAAEFARYGLAVLMAWIATRSIFGRLRQRGVGLQRPPEAWLDQHAVQELAGDTVVVSLDKFRSTVLIPGKWDHTRGASLRTFFIGQCLLQFANIYRAWFAREQRQRHAVPVEDVALWTAHNDADRPVEQQVVLREHVTAELAAVEGSRDRRILGLHSIGYTHRQIGEELGITEKAVESAIGRLRRRRKARQQQDEEETA